MTFHRLLAETIDGLLSRFLQLPHQAALQGTGMTLDCEGTSWLLLRACGCSQHQLLNIMQPY